MKASDELSVWSAIFLMMIGILSTLLYLAYSEVDSQRVKIAAMAKSERAAWGKVYDLQENRDDKSFAEEAAMHLKLFETEQKLEACQAKKG